MMDQWSSDAKPDRGYNNDDTESASDGRMMIHKTKRGRWQKVEFTVTEKRRILELGRMELKEEFEKLQAETLDSLPDSYKLMFGRIGFARCDGRNVILPVLILNPYDAPRNVRSSWVGAFNSLKRQGRLDGLPYLIFRYGTLAAAKGYTLVQQREYVPFEEGVRRGYDKIPNSVQRKVDNKYRLTRNDHSIMRAIRAMMDDLEKIPRERKRGIQTFKEYYEELTLADVDEALESDDSNESADANSIASDSACL